jgi:hypothetical protein
MKKRRPLVFWLITWIGIPHICMLMLFSMTWAYTVGTLKALSAGGVYPSAEDGMVALIHRGYVHPDDFQIIYAGTNSFDGGQPHVWYVIACVWGGTRADGSPVGSSRHVYDQPGVFFINTRDGWVLAPEGVFPEILGNWMQLYGLAGPGSPVPSHNWGSNPDKGCKF